MFKKRIARQMVNRRRKKFPIEYLEQKHVDLSLPYPNDSSYFYGGDKMGNAFICRMAFRGPQRQHEYWCDFYLKSLGFFGVKKDPGSDGEGFQMGNLKWEPLEIGKRWRISYEGPVEDREGNTYQTQVDLIFAGEHPFYSIADSSGSLEAKAIASEKWRKNFFHKLKELSQTHVEQTGKIEGTIILDGRRFDLAMYALKDHTFGSRNWLTWDRHYFISGLADNGYRWTVSVVRFDFLGPLAAGLVIDKDGEVDAVVDCTTLEEVSAKQLLPDKGEIKIKTRSGKTHALEFVRHGDFPHLMDDSYWMCEGIGNFKFSGSEGLGIVEFGFKKGRYLI
jgi:hypothetical protein